MDHSLSSGKTAEVPRSSWRQSILVDNSNDQSSSTQMLSTLANSDSISAISALLQLHQQQGQQEQQQIILQHQEQQELLQQQQQEKLLVQKQQQQQQIQHLIHQVGQQQQQQKNLQYQNQATHATKMEETETENRYQNTMDVLQKSGLLDIALRTSELAKQNQSLQRDLDTLEHIVRATFDTVEDK